MRTDVPIHRLLQRHASGSGGSHVLEAVLREEVGRLAAADQDLNPDRTELRRFVGLPLQAFHDGLFRAVELVASDPARAYDHIRWADAALRELRLYQRSIQQLRQAEECWARLRDDLALQPLVDLPTLRIPRRLLELSRRFLEDGRPRESAVAGRLSRQVLERLAAPDVTGGQGLAARLETLRRGLFEVGEPGADRLDEVARLLGTGHGELSARLAADLEAELLGWRSQARRGKGAAVALEQEICEVARLAESLQQTFRNWVPAEPADQSQKEL